MTGIIYLFSDNENCV